MKNINKTLTAFICLTSVLFSASSCMKESEQNLNKVDDSIIRFNIPNIDTAEKATRSTTNNSKEVALASIKLKSSKKGQETLYLNITEKDFDPVTVEAETDENGNIIKTRGFDYEHFDFELFGHVWKKGGTKYEPYIHAKGNARKALPVKYNSNEDLWLFDNNVEYEWPKTGVEKIRFYGLKNIHGALFEANPPEPEYLYLVVKNDKESLYKDQLVARTEISRQDSEKWGKVVSLHFRHILSGIQFKTGKGIKTGKITSIKLDKVFGGKGKYYFEKNEWKVDYIPSYNAYELNNLNFATTEGDFDKKINEEPIMVLPQKLGTNTTIIVNCTDEDGHSYTLSANLQNEHQTVEWEPGKIYTFYISNESIEQGYTTKIQISADDIKDLNKHLGNWGGTGHFKVVAYKEKENGKIVKPASWHLEYSTDGGRTWTDETPDYVRSITEKGMSSKANPKEEMRGNYDIAHIPAVKVNERMKKIPSKGTEDDPWNLSNSNGRKPVQNTANCYIVDAPGYYRIPLVYGNAIKDYKDNKSSYKAIRLDGAEHVGDYVLSAFINHRGAAIKSPYLKDNPEVRPAKVELMWSDALDLVSDIKYDDTDKGWITFKVGKGAIQEGNAVIAIKDLNNFVLWSWHIWVTDQILGRDQMITEADGSVFYLMRSYLGDCRPYKHNQQDNYRDLLIRARSGDQATNAHINIKQFRGEMTYGHNCTYYQWGRKDPMPGYCGFNVLHEYEQKYKTWNKTIFVGDDRTPLVNDLPTHNPGEGKDCIIWGILNPRSMSANENMDKKYYNLWNIYCDANIDYDSRRNIVLHKKVIKTVYDPCPVGYCVPVKALFKRFSRNGHRHMNNPSQDHFWGAYSGGNGDLENVYHFFPGDQFGLSDPEKIIEFYVTAARAPKNGFVSDADAKEKYSHCWYDTPVTTAANFSNDLGDSFGFSLYPNQILNDEGDHRDRGWGWPVRPMRETY